MSFLLNKLSLSPNFNDRVIFPTHNLSLSLVYKPVFRQPNSRFRRRKRTTLMETPSSLRRTTRSQALALSAKNNTMAILSRENEESDMCVLKSRQRSNHERQEPEKERSVLIDITNDSPIVGLAMGSLKTPSSRFSKKRMIFQNSQTKQFPTPGSGEALLRGQVKTLLQKVEEEAVVSKISFEDKSLTRKQGFMNSPMALLAPTPANTPQVSDFNNGLESFSVSPVAENLNLSQMLEEKVESEEENMITRSLFADFSEDKSSSVDYDDEENYQDYDENGDDGELDYLCVGIRRINVNGAAIFTGKHTRFVYNSDGELEGEEEEEEEELQYSTPEGKRLPFK